SGWSHPDQRGRRDQLCAVRRGRDADTPRSGEPGRRPIRRAGAAQARRGRPRPHLVEYPPRSLAVRCPQLEVRAARHTRSSLLMAAAPSAAAAPTAAATISRPSWMDEFIATYTSGEAHAFLLTGDVGGYAEQTVTHRRYLLEVLKGATKARQVVLYYERSQG